MPAEDSMIIRLHYEEGMSVAEIARTLAIPQKPLYRRLERLLEHLREQLEAEGISRERVSDFLDGAAT
jgi:RNA polymerase sigma factor for flagellar operon FliA